MSETRMRRALVRLLLATVVAAAPALLGAQSIVDSLERPRSEVSARARAADSARRRVGSRDLVPTETLTVDGIPNRLIVQPAGLPRTEATRG